MGRKAYRPIIVGFFGLPKEAVAALLIGFLRKDLAVGMLLGLGITPSPSNHSHHHFGHLLSL